VYLIDKLIHVFFIILDIYLIIIFNMWYMVFLGREVNLGIVMQVFVFRDSFLGIILLGIFLLCFSVVELMEKRIIFFLKYYNIIVFVRFFVD
jgi:hypothetical protein